MSPDHPAFRDFAASVARAAAPLVPTPPVLERLAQASELRVTASNGHFLRIGEMADHILFVVRGLLRFYYLDGETGMERTGQFFDEGRIMTDVESYYARVPARLAIQALEKSEVLALPRTAIHAAFDADHAVERYGRLMVEEALAGAQLRAARLLMLSPDELYRTFVATRPEVARRVPQYLIASYLGITPEALSRIRARLAHRRDG
jgi:CRP-like cAMP-binding protein